MPKVDEKKLRSQDTEGTGLDLYHGALPFFVTICDESQETTHWEWDVDPLTRKPIIPEKDKQEIRREMDGSKYDFVLQNSRYDRRALETIGIDAGNLWKTLYDTLLAGHLLASNQPHDLTSMALVYLGVNIKPWEMALENATKEAVAIVKRRWPEWRLAKRGLLDMPSAKEKVWKFDAWVPRRVAQELNYSDDHPWYRVLSEYSNVDSLITLNLFRIQRRILQEQGLWNIYLERLKLLSIVPEMEQVGMTISGSGLAAMEKEFKEESDRAGRICINIARELDYELTLPKSGTNKSLDTFVFDVLKLKPFKRSEKTGKPSLDKLSLEHYEAELPSKSVASLFVRSLRGKRRRDTALSYMEGYRRFWLPHPEGAKDWYILHPSLNPTGTDTLRWSSSNPNAQNISKQEGFNLRRPFGPGPGREWWSLDYDNIELRIPAYESGEQVMIEIFEKPNDPPYFGSYHLMNASIVYPDLFWPIAEKKGEFKRRYLSTWYQWIKNFGFAVSYGAVLASGTADRAAHKVGAQKLVMDRLKEHTKLNQKMIDFAEKHGYVETIPDKEISPRRGYPLLCSRTNWGRVLPTVPLNFHVQGTACWVVMRAMIKVHAYLKEVSKATGERYSMILNVHDEIVLDFPYKPNMGNKPIILEVKRLMESMGEPISIPLTVGVNYHQNNWAEGIAI